MAVKAQRRQIIIGSIICDGFRTEDGRYWMSQTQGAVIIEEDPRRLSDALRSKWLKSALKEDLGLSEIPKDWLLKDVVVGNIEVNLCSLDLVAYFWQNRSNKKSVARRLCRALMQESLERRFDSAFGITKSEAEYNELLAERSQMADRILTLESEQADLERLARTMMENCDRLFEELQASESYAYGLEIQQNAESLYRWHQEHESFLIQSF